MAHRHCLRNTRNTRTDRICPACLGAGQVASTISRASTKPCPNPQCLDGWVRWAPIDPLEVAHALRHRRLIPAVGVRYGEAMARALTDVALPADVQPMLWAVAA